ncbi:MAG: hypothetical protein SFY67_01345 [Candidatus Melainabacteria bacterium]|nr:hypothetical protein [Candidatus Melainabacteria bacterium]
MTEHRLFVTDTHPLVHFFCDGGRRLSKKARNVFEEATTSGRTGIFVPAPVSLELSMLIEDGAVEINMPFSKWMDALFSHATINPLALDLDVVKIFHEVKYHEDPFDRAIVASTISMELPLITNDSKMHKYKQCELFWD